MKAMSALLLGGALLAGGVFCPARARAETAAEILKKLDTLYRSKTSRSKVEMHIKTPNWERTLKLLMWSRGLDDTFVRIVAPKKDKGVTTLRRGKEMWNFFPKVNKVIKVPPSMMMGSWMGSDFTNDDLVREVSLEKDYVSTLGQGDADTYEIDLQVKPDVPTVWAKITLKVRKKDYQPVEYLYRDEKGKPMRRMVFKDIRKFGNREMPAVMEVIPMTKDGHVTTVKYVDAEFDIPLGDEIFSLRNMRSGT